MKRRTFFSGSIAGAAGLAGISCAGKPHTPEQRELFSFIHFSDVHIRPELGATEGFGAAVAVMNGLDVDFAVSGGDLVSDALAVDETRANLEYDLYEEGRGLIDMPVYDVIGNHEVFGISVPETVPRDHHDWGKGLFRRRLGNGATYRSFDHKGVHFVLLDTIGIEPSGDIHQYFGEIGAEQRAWLTDDLDRIQEGTPVILIGHIPYLSCYELIVNGPNTPLGRTTSLTDGRAFYEIISRHHILGMLVGHMHVNELYRYLNVSYIDTGAICGNWWRGPRDGHPEGFNLVHVYEDGIIAEYITYGWDAARFTT